MVPKMKKVLMIAFHYPPCAAGSGVHRAFNFSRYLPDEGWEPIVLSVWKHAFPKYDDTLLGTIPEKI